MTDIPGMIIWTDAYLADTVHLTTFEHGAYLLILMAMWRSGGKLAKDSKMLALIAKTPPGHWVRIEKKIMEFMTLEQESDGTVYITQKRLRKEYLQSICRNSKRIAAGRAGGLAKALKSNAFVVSNANGNAVANAEHCRTTTITNYKKDSFNSELRQENRWVPTKRVGSRLFKVGELAPAYDGQPPDRWKKLRPEDCT